MIFCEVPATAPPKFDRLSWRMSIAHAKAWIKNLNAQGQSRLTRDQRRSNKRWVETQQPDRSTLLQIGANTHSATGFRSAGGIAYDVGPDAVAKGWKSVLVEPMPTPFAALSKRYQSTPHVKLVNGAVCDNCTLSSPGMDMLYVVVSNATGNWGSRRADGRCLAYHPAEHMFTEIASLSKSHLLRHEPYFRTSKKACQKCTQKLNLTANPLPENCLSKVIRRNIRATHVKCVCPSALINEFPTANRTHLTLLIVDAEGHDANILEQFPFGSVKVDRVTFEALNAVKT